MVFLEGFPFLGLFIHHMYGKETVLISPRLIPQVSTT